MIDKTNLKPVAQTWKSPLAKELEEVLREYLTVPEGLTGFTIRVEVGEAIRVDYSTLAKTAYQFDGNSLKEIAALWASDCKPVAAIPPEKLIEKTEGDSMANFFKSSEHEGKS